MRVRCWAVCLPDMARNVRGKCFPDQLAVLLGNLKFLSIAFILLFIYGQIPSPVSSRKCTSSQNSFTTENLLIRNKKAITTIFFRCMHKTKANNDSSITILLIESQWLAYENVASIPVLFWDENLALES